MVQHTDSGVIEISKQTIGALVSYATTHTYGVVGMTTSTRARGIAATITRDPNRGVKVTIDENDQSLTIDVYIVIEYGTNIASVANSLINSIRYYVESSTGLKVYQVNIHVQDLRMSSPNQAI
ncbi:MAG: Asp23/Gls24 family envelope stress response protein [Anaerolineae bacterium]|jgi:uncharacterized alkaline shock family protein YloU|nr:Asp23/Gls24 family envelope stress response protein [Anaerolineae bacterium]